MSRACAVGLYAMAAIVGACGSSQATQPELTRRIDRIELQAWRETLGPAYPLTITRSDSIATVLGFFAPSAAAWRNAAEFPGIPILAAFLEGDQLSEEYGFVETSHLQGGFLVNRTGTRIRVRTASPADIERFLAFFGLHTEIRGP